MIANLHYFPGLDQASTSASGSPTGSRRSCWGRPAGVRACQDFFGDEAFLVISGDALTDIDLTALANRHSRGRRDRHAGGQEGPGHTRVRCRAARPRWQDHGLSGEAGSRRRRSLTSATAGSMSSPRRSSTTSRPSRSPTGPRTCFPALLENDVPFHIHEVREYWNDVGSLGELRQGTFDALRCELDLEMEGE